MKTIEYLSEAETGNVLAAAKRHSARAACMFTLAYWHALRASEIAALTLADVEGSKLNVRRAKGSQHTIQPMLRAEEKQALAAWLRVRGADPSPYLFTTRQGGKITRRQVYNLFETIAMEAGIDRSRRHPHILKHSLCTHAHQHGMGLVDIQQLAGHAHISSTIRYTHTTQEEAAAKALAAMPGLAA
jgi:site-specific recombinase XerD